MKNPIIKNALILFAVALVAGVLLGTVYEVTKAPIAAAELERKQEAYKKVFSEASDYKKDDTFDESKAASFMSENGYKDDISEVVNVIGSDGSQIGYILDVTSHEGYGGDIEFQMGIKNDGSVTGIELLSISETAGLGMQATNASFRNQYVGKQVSEFTVTKTGSTQDSEINALSGATITSKAMTNGVNSGLAYYKEVLGGAK